MRALLKCLLNTDRHVTSNTSLGGLFQYLITLTVNKFFFMFSLTLPWHSFVSLSHPLTSFPWLPERRDWHLTSSFPPQEAVVSMRLPHSLLLSKLDNASVCPQPPLTEHNRTASAKYNGRVTS